MFATSSTDAIFSRLIGWVGTGRAGAASSARTSVLPTTYYFHVGCSMKAVSKSSIAPTSGCSTVISGVVAPLLDGENGGGGGVGGRRLSCNETPAAAIPASPAESINRTGSKTCCFCWCCCCSCSCVTVTNMEEAYLPKDSNRSDMSKEETLSAEEVKLWGESFDRLMQSNKGRKYFRDFLRTEFSEENVLFWLACEELKRETNAELIEEKARSIYEDYISILSPKEVSLDSRAREVINRNMVHPSPHTFDEAQLQIYTLMHRDSYPRFLNSSVYKRLIQ